MVRCFSLLDISQVFYDVSGMRAVGQVSLPNLLEFPILVGGGFPAVDSKKTRAGITSRGLVQPRPMRERDRVGASQLLGEGS